MVMAGSESHLSSSARSVPCYVWISHRNLRFTSTTIDKRDRIRVMSCNSTVLLVVRLLGNVPISKPLLICFYHSGSSDIIISLISDLYAPEVSLTFRDHFYGASCRTLTNSRTPAFPPRFMRCGTAYSRNPPLETTPSLSHRSLRSPDSERNTKNQSPTTPLILTGPRPRNEHVPINSSTHPPNQIDGSEYHD
jgi:hypothetical protein